MSTKRGHLAPLALAGALVLAACGNGAPAGEQPEETGDTPDASYEPAPQPDLIPAEDRELADDQNIVIRQYSEPVGFDPATIFRIDTEMIALNLYNGLTSFDPLTAEPLPGLAEDWDISDDGLTYTFYLVEDATWHFDYGDFTSADVVYSYERIMDPDTGSPYRAEFDLIDTIEAIDDYTVEITLTEPDGNFLLQVTNNHQGQIVNEQAIEDFGDNYPRNPVGTGPFYLDSWTQNSTLVLRGHEDYHLGAPHLESVTFDLITDSSSAETSLLNGDVDAAAGVNSFNLEQYERVSAAEGFEVFTAASYTTNAWLFGSDFEPWQDPDVRRAFVMAMDNEAIVDAVAPHATSPYTAILPPWMDVNDPDVPYIDYDPDGAIELLEQAGYPEGFTVRLITPSPSETQVLQQDLLSQVGINLEFDIVEIPVFNQRRQAGDFELSFRVYPAINPDTLLFGYLHPDNAAPVGMNGFKVDDPELTELLESARSELDADTRAELYAQIQQHAAEQVLYPAATTMNNTWAAREGVRNIQVNQLAGVDLFPVYLEPTD